MKLTVVVMLRAMRVDSGVQGKFPKELEVEMDWFIQWLRLRLYWVADNLTVIADEMDPEFLGYIEEDDSLVGWLYPINCSNGCSNDSLDFLDEIVAERGPEFAGMVADELARRRSARFFDGYFEGGE